jgi:hypothetical protein
MECDLYPTSGVFPTFDQLLTVTPFCSPDDVTRYKILKVLTGEADVAVLNLKTSLWDTCATEALVRTARSLSF